MSPLALVLAAAAGAPGGVYHTPAPAAAPKAADYIPNETCPFLVKDGVADPLPFSSFSLRYATLLNIANPKPPNAAAAADRKAVLARLAARGSRPATPEQAAGIAAEQLRLGNLREALNALTPFTRTEPIDFRVMANYTHVFASQGDWENAGRFHGMVVSIRGGFPHNLPGIKPEQVPWLQSVEMRYYDKWLRIHQFRKPKPETEEPFPLFGEVKFVNDAGVYEPGKLAADEKKKLPADAMAVVQQLLLWSPEDTGLYWLLGELYAVDGQFEEAKRIFDICVDTRQYSNRKVLKDHRQALIETLAAQPKPAEEPPPDKTEGLPPKSTVYIILAVFIPVALVLVLFQLRVFRRKLARLFSRR